MSIKHFFEKKWNSIRKRLRFLVRPFLKLKFKNLVVIEQKGGLGSQLGLYVVGEYLREHCGHKVVYDLSWFERDGMSIDGKNTRKWELENLFELKLPIAERSAVSWLRNWAPIKQKNNFCTASDLKKRIAPYFMGIEQNSLEFYIAMKPLFKLLRFKENIVDENRLKLERIKNAKNSCAVHVRRGDYVGSIHDLCGIDYFLSAIKEVQKRINGGGKIFIFSNGFDWVEKELLPKLPPDIEVECMKDSDNDHMHGDFYLMSQCQHQIVSNSGYSWLSTLMREDDAGRIIIEPREWIRGQIRETYPGHIALTKDGKLAGTD